MYQYRPDEIAEHTDSLAYYRIFNIWLAQFKKSTNSCEMAYRNKRHQGAAMREFGEEAPKSGQP